MYEAPSTYKSDNLTQAHEIKGNLEQKQGKRNRKTKTFVQSH